MKAEQSTALVTDGTQKANLLLEPLPEFTDQVEVTFNVLGAKTPDTFLPLKTNQFDIIAAVTERLQRFSRAK